MPTKTNTSLKHGHCFYLLQGQYGAHHPSSMEHTTHASNGSTKLTSSMRMRAPLKQVPLQSRNSVPTMVLGLNPTEQIHPVHIIAHNQNRIRKISIPRINISALLEEMAMEPPPQAQTRGTQHISGIVQSLGTSLTLAWLGPAFRGLL